MSGLKKLELDFLWEVSNCLAKVTDEASFIDELKVIFEKYLNVNNFRIFLWDEHSASLRDFVKNWIIIEKNARNEGVQKIFCMLKHTKDKKSFVLNNNILSFCSSMLELENKFSQYLKPENNILYFPIKNEKDTLGVLELDFDEIINEVKKSDFLISLGISATQISGAVINKILNNQMLVNINFHNVMKNIAKLIETQYELTYIIPIIGEMVDKFVVEHLIYIFMKDKNEGYRLVWPSDCTDEKILSMLEHFKDTKNNVISPDSKAGVWAIKNQDKTIGAVAAGSSFDKLSEKDIEYISLLTKQASITIEKADSYAKMLQYATLDALTGLNNRRQFEVRLNQEVATARRKNKPLCCIMTDIDYFKKVNDTYGHAAGDCVLKNVAKIITAELREYDIASRYGGEEFCILLPYTNLNEAEFVANRLRAAVEKTQINISDIDKLNVTISVGVSSFDEKFETAQELYERADSALYEAKKNGRNRVVVFKGSN